MMLLRWTLVLAFALVAFGAGSDAFAQEAAGTDDEAGPTLEQDLDTFWAEQRRVRVLQRRLYETDGDFQLTLYVGVVPNDPFINYYPIGGRFGYHITESIAVELAGSYMIDSNTDLADFLDREGDVSVFLRDVQKWRANFTVLWSPIYGKFSFLGTKLAHFDWFFGAGVGVLGAENPDADNLNEFSVGVKPEVALATGWNLHLHQRWALRLDYRQFIFQKEDGGVALPSELSLGASFFF